MKGTSKKDDKSLISMN